MIQVVLNFSGFRLDESSLMQLQLDWKSEILELPLPMIVELTDPLYGQVKGAICGALGYVNERNSVISQLGGMPDDFWKASAFIPPAYAPVAALMGQLLPDLAVLYCMAKRVKNKRENDQEQFKFVTVLAHIERHQPYGHQQDQVS